MRTVEIELLCSFPMGVSKWHSLYLTALEDMLTFGEGPYLVRNKPRVELCSN